MGQQTTEPKKRRRPLVIIGIAAGVLAGLCLCVVVLGGLIPNSITEKTEAPIVTEPAQRVQDVAVATVPPSPADTPEQVSTPESISVPEPTLTLEPSPTPIPTATPEPAEPGLSRSNPLPLGTEFIGETWSITVTDVIRGEEAAQAIAAANQFNDPPKQDYEYLIANIVLKNVSDEQDAQSAIFAVDLRVTGDKNIVYSSASVVPPKPLEGEMFPGGSVEGQVVFEVPSDETNLMFIVDELLSFDFDAKRFVAIDPEAKIVPDASLNEIAPTDLGSRRDSPAKIGDTLVTRSWEFQVVEVVRGDTAAELAKNANMFNEPAPEGQEYIAVRLKARYLSGDDPDDRENIDGSFLKIAGANNVVYESPSVVPPPPIFNATLFAGGETEGWEILSASEGEQSLILIIEPPLSFRNDVARYVSLD